MIAEAGIAVNREIAVRTLNDLARKHQIPAALADTGRFLEKAEHTASQLRVYLARREYSLETGEHVVKWAQEQDCINDARYAKMFITSHTIRSPMGDRRLRAELRKRGVSEEIIVHVLAERNDDELIPDLVDSIRRKYGSLDRETAFRRAAAFLSRRGFSSSTTYRVIREAIDNEKSNL